MATNKIEALLGLQWGDEGKGKWIDALAPKYDIVARFQGGANAGHTLIVNGQKIVLHQIPSAVLHPNVQLFIGDGVALNLIALYKEAKSLTEYMGQDALKGRLFISAGAHVITPISIFLDELQESGVRPIGSTLKGIGPAYREAVGRGGLNVYNNPLRVYDTGMGDKEESEKIRKHIEWQMKDRRLTKKEIEKVKELWDEHYRSADNITDFLRKNAAWVDGMVYIHDALSNGKKILAEGAQGTMLDITHGTYPYVTSSHTIAGGICTGLGVPPQRIGKVYGVAKAYCTRVGEGPFPTEIEDNETQDLLQEAGQEVGATTGRKRRCGWLDIHALRYAVMLNGVEELFLSKVDILSQLDRIQVCTGYKLKKIGTPFAFSMPYHMDRIDPIYKDMPSWPEGDAQYEQLAALPLGKRKAGLHPALRKYIDLIECVVGVPVTRISYGVERNATLRLK